MRRILVLCGTRPEVIKLAPVVRALRLRPKDFETRIVLTGQHREMAQQAAEAFDLAADVRLDAMPSASSLANLTGWLFSAIDEVLQRELPDWVVVQGDTTSAMVGAVCAFYRRCKVAHVEAGLRTFDRFAPFPEEINRTFIGHVANRHFAPTQRAADCLLAAGADKESIQVVGNTVVDALLWTLDRIGDTVPSGIPADIPGFIDGKRLVLVTGHRRESFGEGFANICEGLLRVVEAVEDAVIVYPVHLNPHVYEPVHKLLGHHPRIKLIDPVSYVPFVWLMQKSYIIVSDSGGIQEEAPTLGKPVLVMRDVTERPEVIEAGCARLVGASAEGISASAIDLLSNDGTYRSMTGIPNPFGDGHAAERIVTALGERY